MRRLATLAAFALTTACASDYQAPEAMEAEELEPPSCMEMAADLYHVCSVRWAGGSASCPEDCQASIADCIHDLEPEAQDVCGFDEACKSDYFEAREEWRAASEPLCLAGLKECPSCPE